MLAAVLLHLSIIPGAGLKSRYAVLREGEQERANDHHVRLCWVPKLVPIHSAHTSLAEASHMAKPDINGEPLPTERHKSHDHRQKR